MCAVPARPAGTGCPYRALAQAPEEGVVFPPKRGKAESRRVPATAWSDDLVLVKGCSNPPADGGEGQLEIPEGGFSQPG